MLKIKRKQTFLAFSTAAMCLTNAVLGASFTDDHNDGVLSSWTKSGRNWTESNGVASPVSASNLTGFLIRNGACSQNGTLSVTIKADQWNGNRGGVVFRYSSSSAYYYVAILPGNQYNNSIKLLKGTTDINSTGAITVAQNFAMNSTFTLKIVMNGGKFDFYIDGILRGSVTDNTYSSGQIGYGYSTDYNDYIDFDNIQWTEATNTAPTIVTAATANPATVTGTSTALTVLGADDGGESKLTYTWSSSGPGSVGFNANGTNAAKNVTATFSKTGSYTITATIKDAAGLSVQSSTTVTVTPTASAIGIVPSSFAIAKNDSFQFVSQLKDQFGNILITQPQASWSVTGGGTIGSGGRFYSGSTVGGPYTITVTKGTLSSTSKVYIRKGQHTDLNIIGKTNSSITLDWTAFPQSVTSSEVYRNGILLGTTNQLQYTDATVIKDSTYNYEVKVISGGMKISLSNVISTTGGIQHTRIPVRKEWLSSNATQAELCFDNVWVTNGGKYELSTGSNPATVTVTFPYSQRVTCARAVAGSAEEPTASYSWTVEAANSMSDLQNKTNTYIKLVNNRTGKPGSWDESVFGSAVSRTIFIFTVKRNDGTIVKIPELELCTDELKVLPVQSKYKLMVVMYDPDVNGSTASQIAGFYDSACVNKNVSATVDYLKRATGGKLDISYTINKINAFPPLEGRSQLPVKEWLDGRAIKADTFFGKFDRRAMINDPGLGVNTKINNGDIDLVWYTSVPNVGIEWESEMAGTFASYTSHGVIKMDNLDKFQLMWFPTHYSSSNNYASRGGFFEHLTHNAEQFMRGIAQLYWPKNKIVPVVTSWDMSSANTSSGPAPYVYSRAINDFERFSLTDQRNYSLGTNSFMADYTASPGYAQIGTGHYAPYTARDYIWTGTADWQISNYLGPDNYRTVMSGTWDYDQSLRKIYFKRSSSSTSGVLLWGRAPISDMHSDFDYTSTVDISNLVGTASFVFRCSKVGTIANIDPITGSGSASGFGYIAGIYKYGSNSKLFLAKMTGNSIQFLKTVPAIVDYTDNKFRVTAQGTTISVYLGDLINPAITVQDNSYSCGGIAYAAELVNIAFRPISLFASTMSGADNWYTYPVENSPMRRIAAKDFHPDPATDTGRVNFFRWYYEHLPKNSGLHNSFDLERNVMYKGLLNTWIPYIFSPNEFCGNAIYDVAIPNIVDTKAPAQPTGLRYTVRSDSTVVIEWNASTEEDITSYDLYRDGVFNMSSYSQSALDKLVLKGTHVYELRARDGSGNVSTAASITANIQY